MLSNKDIAKRYTKSTLLLLANEELDMNVSDNTRANEIVDLIKHDLEVNGIIEGDVSDDMFDLMIALGFIDEDGNVLDEGSKEEGGQSKEQTEDPKSQECFGWRDATNPSCARCKQSAACELRTIQRIADQPCWGEYESDDGQCEMCIMWRRCEQNTPAVDAVK